VIVDNTGKIRYIECNFFGHLNDAHLFAIMCCIGKDLPFPDECVLLGDTIYSNSTRLQSVTELSAQYGEVSNGVVTIWADRVCRKKVIS